MVRQHEYVLEYTGNLLLLRKLIVVTGEKTELSLRLILRPE